MESVFHPSIVKHLKTFSVEKHEFVKTKARTVQHSVVVSQNTEALSTEIPEHRVLKFRNTAKFESVG